MRKTKPKKRILLPDPKFNDTLVTRFVNNVMLNGKKTKAFKSFYDALDVVEQKTGENGLEVFKKALNNITQSKDKTILIEWLKLIKHSRISDFN